MKFKDKSKTAIAKILSDLIQSDGIVNQGEIDYLNMVCNELDISLANLQKSENIALSEAVSILRNCGDTEKSALMQIIQQIVMSDNSLSPDEALMVTALLLALGIETEETRDLKANIISVPGLNFETRNAVLYVEPYFDKDINSSILKDYDKITKILSHQKMDFFYLPIVQESIINKKNIFRNMLQYIKPALTDIDIDTIEKGMEKMSTESLSKELFINYLNSNGLILKKPSFFLKISSSAHILNNDYLIIEINSSPLETIKRFCYLKDNVTKIIPKTSSFKEAYRLRKLTMPHYEEKKDELQYTGFHKVIIDTILKYHGGNAISRIYIGKNGKITLPDMNNIEIKIPALCRAIYILYLLHEDGIALNELNDHSDELLHIYGRISSYGDKEKLYKAVKSTVDVVGVTLNSNLSRIKRAISLTLGDEAGLYQIQGDRNTKKRINLDRKMVVFEDRTWFEKH